jgi:hypothetical protein
MGEKSVNKKSSKNSKPLLTTKKNEDEVSTPKIIAMIAAIIGLTTLLYVVPNRTSREVIQKNTDSIFEKKSVVNDTIKDTLNLFI